MLYFIGIIAGIMAAWIIWKVLDSVDVGKKRKKIMDQHRRGMEIIHFFSKQTGIPVCDILPNDPNIVIKVISLDMYYIGKQGNVARNDNPLEIKGLVSFELIKSFVLDIDVRTGIIRGAYISKEKTTFIRGIGSIHGPSWSLNEVDRRDSSPLGNLLYLYSASDEYVPISLIDRSSCSELERMLVILKFVEKYPSCVHLRLDQLKRALRGKDIIPSQKIKLLFELFEKLEKENDSNPDVLVKMMKAGMKE